MKRMMIFAVLIAVAVLFVVPVLAQDGKVDVLPDFDYRQVMSPEDALILLSNTLTSIVGSVVGAPLVIGLVALLKQLIPEKYISSRQLQVVMAVVVTLAIWIANATGTIVHFETGAEFVATVAMAMVALFSNIAVSGAVHNAANRFDVPFVGSERRDFNTPVVANG